MRIISQNGKFSIPFEQCVVTCDSNLIHCVVMNGNQFIVGEYSTMQKAQRAMDILHEKYNSIEIMRLSGTPEIFGKMNMLLSEDDFDEVTGSVFRFPDDDEIEVNP